MKHHSHVKQRSAFWKQLRIGKANASEAETILTPTGQFSKQSARYRNEILAEMMLGHPLESVETQYMERGTLLEDDAIQAYEILTDRETSPGGYVTNDAETVGASPDRLIGTNGILEIKCPGAAIHMGHLVTQSVEGHKPQVQFQLWVCEREYVAILSYYPGLPAMISEVGRDEPYIEKLRVAVEQFVADLLEKRRELEGRYGPFPDPLEGLEDDSPPWRTDDIVTEADLDQIIQLRKQQGFAR